MTFMGRVSDIAGRRAVYLICLVIFFVGSWIVAASPGWPTEIARRIVQLFGARPAAGFASLYALIVGRVIQPSAQGAMVPVSMALVADLFPPEKRALPSDRRRSRHGRLGAGAPLRRDHGSVHELAVSRSDQSPGHRLMFCVTWWGWPGCPACR